MSFGNSHFYSKNYNYPEISHYHTCKQINIISPMQKFIIYLSCILIVVVIQAEITVLERIEQQHQQLQENQQSHFTPTPLNGSAPIGSNSYTMAYNDKKLVLFGGASSVGAYDQFLQFDLEKKLWTNIYSDSNFPSKRTGAVSTFQNGLYYLFGGSDGANFVCILYIYHYCILKLMIIV
jgi:hypothetical protein